MKAFTFTINVSGEVEVKIKAKTEAKAREAAQTIADQMYISRHAWELPAKAGVVVEDVTEDLSTEVNE